MWTTKPIFDALLYMTLCIGYDLWLIYTTVTSHVPLRLLHPSGNYVNFCTLCSSHVSITEQFPAHFPHLVSEQQGTMTY